MTTDFQVFDLHGSTLQRIPAPPPPGPEDEAGRYNNVALLYGFALGRSRVDLAVVTDRGRDKLMIYRINPNYGPLVPPLTDITAANAPWVFNTSQ